MTSPLSRRSMLTALSALAAVAVVPSVTDAQLAQATLRLGVGPADSYSQGYYAKDMGFFTAAGLDVTVETQASGAVTASALIGGSIDIGIGSPVVIATAFENGVPLQFFAPGCIYDQNAPTTLLMVAKASPLSKAADLRGRTIAADSLGSMTTVAIGAWLAHENVDLASVRLVEIPFSAMGAALDAGRVDGAFIAEPALSASRAVTREFANPYASIANRFFISSWFATKPWLESNRAIAKKFLAVMQHTSAWANHNHAASAPILQAYTKLSSDTLHAMRRAGSSESLDASLMQPVLDAAAKGQVLKSSLRASDIIFQV